MAKSKRSKVKMAYKAMRRHTLQPAHDAKLREHCARTYETLGLPLPEPRDESKRMPARAHNGSTLVTTFVPTPKGPKLNVVHGPLAEENTVDRLELPPIGLPIVGAGAIARMEAEMNVNEEGKSLKTERVPWDERLYFYPRKEKRRTSGINKKRSTRHPQNRTRANLERMVL